MDPLFFEDLIVRMLFTDKEGRDTLYPHLRADIFTKPEAYKLTEMFMRFRAKYDKYPNMKEMGLYLENAGVFDYLKSCVSIDQAEYSNDLVKDMMQEFISRKLTFKVAEDVANKIAENAEISELGDYSDKLRDAIAFSFDTTVGLDLLNEAERLYEAMHDKDRVVPSGIENLDNLMGGGFHEKSLTLLLAQTNLGKTLIKCAFAVNALLHNKKVLYITLEVAETEIAKRMIANLIDIAVNDLAKIPKKQFMDALESQKAALKANLIIKEYPPRSVNANRLRNLFRDLETKKKFKCDIAFLDYMGLVVPNAIKKEGNTNTELKVVSEEVRALAVEFAVPFVSAMQTNRGGFASAEIDLTDIADSIGTTMTADVIYGVTQTPEMREAGLYSFILLKNRFGINGLKTMVGVDYPKMRVFNVDMDGGGEVKQVDAVDDAVVRLQNSMKNNKDTELKNIINF